MSIVWCCFVDYWCDLSTQYIVWCSYCWSWVAFYVQCTMSFSTFWNCFTLLLVFEASFMFCIHYSSIVIIYTELFANFTAAEHMKIIIIRKKYVFYMCNEFCLIFVAIYRKSLWINIYPNYIYSELTPCQHDAIFSVKIQPVLCFRLQSIMSKTAI